MAHVIAPDLIGAVGEAVRMAVVGRAQQQQRRGQRAAGDDDDIGRVALLLAVRASRARR